jgi:ssDNA-binding Zn-finger/Zn-ribbon topoisomerase 1
MKKIIVLAVAFLLCAPVIFAQSKAGKQDTTQHASFYTCPMHPDVVADKPGKCPKCGMDLNLSSKEELKSKVTKTYTCPVHADLVSDSEGTCPKCSKLLTLSPKERMKAEAVKIYTCPMHADVASKGAGKCAKCGMALSIKQ